MGVIFWAMMPPVFLLTVFLLIKGELPRVLPLTRNIVLAIVAYIVAIASIIISFTLINTLNLVYLFITLAFLAGGTLLPQVPRQKSLRDLLLAFAIGVGFYYTILHDPLPPGGDVWAKPYLARSAAMSILSLTEPGWDIGWYLGFDYTLYGAFSPMFSGITAIISGDCFFASRIEIFTAFLLIPPLAYLAGRRISGSRWGGFITMAILTTARMNLGYIGISRFWALPMLLALTLALWRWRAGKYRYGAYLVILLACCLFTHAQLLLMALLLFGGFSLEMLWRHRKGQFSSWLLILTGIVAITAIWWQNYLLSATVLRTTPKFYPWLPLAFFQNLDISLSILLRMINDSLYYSLIPDIYSENYYLGLITVIAGIAGLVASTRIKKHKGLFPLAWVGLLVIVLNLPLLYSIPILGNLIQHISYPGFATEGDSELKVGMQQRLMLPALMMLALLASCLAKLQAKKIKAPLLKAVAYLLPFIITGAVMTENFPFAEAFTNHGVSQDPRRMMFYSELTSYIKQLPSDEKLYFHPTLMYSSALISALHNKSMLSGWLASGSNHLFRDNILRPLGVAVAVDPQGAIRMLAKLGVGTLILPDNAAGKAFLAKAGFDGGLQRGVYLVVNIPDTAQYLNVAIPVPMPDGGSFDINDWIEQQGRIYTDGVNSDYGVNNYAAGPSMWQKGVRKLPNRFEIEYGITSTSAIALSLAYQPALAATLDDEPLCLQEDVFSGFIWFKSPPGHHKLTIFRSRNWAGWLALWASLLSLVLLLFISLGVQIHFKS